MRGRLGRCCAVSLVALLAACGGGSDDGISVTISPPAINSPYVPEWDVLRLGFRATLSPVPSVAYPRIVDSGNILVPGATTATANADGSFLVILELQTGLAVGTHTGTFTLELCKDQACTSLHPLAGNVVPYTIHITPQVDTTATATFSVDGAPVTATGGTLDAHGVRLYAVTMRSGSSLTIASSVPMASWSRMVSGYGYASLTYTAYAPSQVTAQIILVNPAAASERQHIKAIAADGQMFSIDVTVTP